MSSTSYSSSDPPSDPSPDQPDQSTPPDQKKPLLALPEKAHNAGTTTLDMSNGDTSVKLDHLGPMVVNADGTLARISNWAGMTEMEQKATLRVIGKRNQERLAAIRAKEGEK
jgi:hypothetical protein